MKNKQQQIKMIRHLLSGDPPLREAKTWVIRTDASNNVIDAPAGYPDQVQSHDEVLIIKREIIR